MPTYLPRYYTYTVLQGRRQFCSSCSSQHRSCLTSHPTADIFRSSNSSERRYVPAIPVSQTLPLLFVCPTRLAANPPVLPQAQCCSSLPFSPFSRQRTPKRHLLLTIAPLRTADPCPTSILDTYLLLPAGCKTGDGPLSIQKPNRFSILYCVGARAELVLVCPSSSDLLENSNKGNLRSTREKDWVRPG